MKFNSVTMLALAASASAHTLMSEIYIDGNAQGSGTCLRMPNDPEKATFPVEDLTSDNMACGFNGETGVDRVCGIDGGSTLTFEFRQWPDDASRGALAYDHKGSCAVYLKKVDDATTATGAGDGWFKLWDQGYDEDTGVWCTDKMIADGGRLSVEIPKTLQGGYYLARSELLALHNANQNPADPQFYVSCAQIFVSNAGSMVPASTDEVSIPGYVSISDESVTFNIYAEPMGTYTVPGPAVYSGVSSSVNTVSKQAVGLESNCIVTNGNWCGTEVESYSTSDDCWTQSAACWDQVHTCYSDAPPTGHVGCQIMDDKCTNIDNQCNAGNFNGPPDSGKNLDPTASSVSIPAVVNALYSYGTATAVASQAVSSSSSSAVATSSAASSSAAYVAAYVESSSSAAASTVSSYNSYSSIEAVSPTSTAQASAPATTDNASEPDIVTVNDYETVNVMVTVYATATPEPVARRDSQNSINRGNANSRKMHSRHHIRQANARRGAHMA